MTGIDEEYFKERMQEWLHEALNDQMNTFKSPEGYIDDIAVGDVVKNMSESVFNNEAMMKQLFKVYRTSFNNNPEYKLLKYYDFKAYKLVAYDFDLQYQPGDTVVLTVLDESAGIPRDIEAAVIDDSTAGFNGAEIKFNSKCVRLVIRKGNL